MENTMKKAVSLIGLLMTLAIPSGLLAQQAGYSQTSLVSNIPGAANATDPQLLNLSSSPMYDAELRRSKTVERCAGVANCDTEPQDQKHEGF
jgi:hypothetical protein